MWSSFQLDLLMHITVFKHFVRGGKIAIAPKRWDGYNYSSYTTTAGHAGLEGALALLDIL